jgi:arylsulfatase A-like enzyme
MMRPARGWLGRSARHVRAALVAPPVVGALVVLGLAAWAGQRGAGDEADVCDLRRADAVESFVAHRFASEITRMKIGIAATAIALGLVIGLVAEALLRVRYESRELAARKAWRALGETAIVCFAVHGALMLWAMADSPQLYAARWYGKGGLARTTQVLATDVLGPRGVVLLAVAVGVFYMKPARIAALAREARAGLLPLLTKAARKAAPPALLLLVGALAFRSIERPRAALAAPPPGVRGLTNSAGPSANAAPPSTTRPPNILILAADSLRDDRLEPRVAPNLSRLAARGARFERAYVSIPRTFPSWVTILSGRHSHHHGIRSMFPTWEERAHDFDALPARLAAAGYTTGVVSDYAGDIFGRIELGFARVDTPSFDFRQLIRQRALERETPLLPLLHSHLGRRLFPVMRELNDAADPMLLADDVASALHAMKDKPFFLTVFFSTAHFPYAAPAPFYAKYTDPAYRGRFKYHKPVGLAGDDAPPDAADIAQIQALYDGSVSAVDAAAGRVLAALEREGLAENTIVVVTSDHGETLYDHGHGQGHGDHLFGDEGTHVPLVVYDPRGGAKPGVREKGIVRDVDLAPTLYDLAGVQKPADLDGRSRAPARAGAAVEPRFAYAESELWFTEEIPGLAPDMRLPYPGIMALTELDSRHNAEIVQRRDLLAVTRLARHRMIRDERWKLVYVPTRKGVKYMLFDGADETHDVASANAGEVNRLRAELWKWMLQDPLMEQKDGYLVPRPQPGSAGGAP